MPQGQNVLSRDPEIGIFKKKYLQFRDCRTVIPATVPAKGKCESSPCEEKCKYTSWQRNIRQCIITGDKSGLLACLCTPQRTKDSHTVYMGPFFRTLFTDITNNCKVKKVNTITDNKSKHFLLPKAL